MKDKPDNLCLAPFLHTYLSPQTERRLCCASREPAQNFRQYIDTADGTNEYKPQTLDEWWNGEHIRRVRRQMMAGELPPECEVCDKKLLNTDVYRDYFWHLFKHKYNQIAETTDATGYTTMQPVSWDYRFSNLCNFKCRMCGPMLSSSWETEARKQGKIEPWMEPSVKKQISNYQDTQIEAEFARAVEEHRMEEIYWVGGEPLMYEQHWRYMQRIIELGDGPGLYARYNTNLSRVDYQGVNLYTDILDKIRDWQICASLDGVGKIGEYIRTGLKYDEWLENFKQGLAYAKNKRMMRIDFTLTTPGLFQVPEITKLADELDVEILAKVCFAFTPDIAMSPLFLPRHILEQIINSIVPNTKGAMRDVLINLLKRKTFEEEYPSEVYLEARCRAKHRMESLDTGRKGTRFIDTLRDPALIKWWKDIPDAVD
jgi:sulfatase maturation enzyme AslB (radical SAM superfamily)